jgi:hypothetical protein
LLLLVGRTALEDDWRRREGEYTPRTEEKKKKLGEGKIRGVEGGKGGGENFKRGAKD